MVKNLPPRRRRQPLLGSRYPPPPLIWEVGLPFLFSSIAPPNHHRFPQGLFFTPGHPNLSRLPIMHFKEPGQESPPETCPAHSHVSVTGNSWAALLVVQAVAAVGGGGRGRWRPWAVAAGLQGAEQREGEKDGGVSVDLSSEKRCLFCFSFCFYFLKECQSVVTPSLYPDNLCVLDFSF